MKRRVVITGMGAVTPTGNSVKEFWESVRAGRCGVGPITRFDASGYKCSLAAEVKNFDPKLWDQEKYSIVLRGNIAKFSQNPELLAFLDSTGDSVLVEGSPYDGIWGVKLNADDPAVQNPDNWRGENLLGFALMETRDILRQRKQENGEA